MKVVVWTLLATVSLVSIGYGLAHRAPKVQPGSAVFAAGCFWGVQAAFDRVPGVISTEAGYTGGDDARPTHGSVAMGNSGHVEAVRVTYDPTKVSYAELLDAFWSCHNPTVDLSTGPGQGAGRSMIFTSTSLQDQQARQSLQELTDARQYPTPIVTEIVPAKTFFTAEAEHQNFADRNGGGARCAAPGPRIHTQLAACAKRIRTGY